jgi:hypothetical protein
MHFRRKDILDSTDSNRSVPLFLGIQVKVLPAGASCLVDANIFIYHLAGLSNECTQFMARVGIRQGADSVGRADKGRIERLRIGFGVRALACSSSTRLGLVKFERLDMRERLRLSKTRNCFHRSPRTGADDHVRATQLPDGPIGKSGLNCPRSYEPSGS